MIPRLPSDRDSTPVARRHPLARGSEMMSLP